MKQSHHLSHIDHPDHNCFRCGTGRIGTIDISTAPNTTHSGASNIWCLGVERQTYSIRPFTSYPILLFHVNARAGW